MSLPDHLIEDHWYAPELVADLDDLTAAALHVDEHAESRWRHSHPDLADPPE